MVFERFAQLLPCLLSGLTAVALVASSSASAQEDARARKTFSGLFPAPPTGWTAGKAVYHSRPDGSLFATVTFSKGKDFVMLRFRTFSQPRHVDYRKAVRTDPHLKRVRAEAIIVGRTAVLYYRAGRRWLALGYASPRVSAAVYVHQPDGDDVGRALGIRVIRSIAWDRLAKVSIPPK